MGRFTFLQFWQPRWFRRTIINSRNRQRLIHADYSWGQNACLHHWDHFTSEWLGIPIHRKPTWTGSVDTRVQRSSVIRSVPFCFSVIRFAPFKILERGKNGAEQGLILSSKITFLFWIVGFRHVKVAWPRSTKVIHFHKNTHFSDFPQYAHRLFRPQ